VQARFDVKGLGKDEYRLRDDELPIIGLYTEGGVAF
jgi:hypothetical protein